MSGDRPFARFKILDMKRSEADLGLLQRPTIITKHSILDVVAVLDPPVSSKRNESLNQEIKHEIYFYDESNYYYCSCRFFAKKVSYANTSLPLLKKD